MEFKCFLLVPKHQLAVSNPVLRNDFRKCVFSNQRVNLFFANYLFSCEVKLVLVNSAEDELFQQMFQKCRVLLLQFVLMQIHLYFQRWALIVQGWLNLRLKVQIMRQGIFTVLASQSQNIQPQCKYKQCSRYIHSHLICRRSHWADGRARMACSILSLATW